MPVQLKLHITEPLKQKYVTLFSAGASPLSQSSHDHTAKPAMADAAAVYKLIVLI